MSYKQLIISLILIGSAPMLNAGNGSRFGPDVTDCPFYVLSEKTKTRPKDTGTESRNVPSVPRKGTADISIRDIEKNVSVLFRTLRLYSSEMLDEVQYWPLLGLQSDNNISIKIIY